MVVQCNTKLLLQASSMAVAPAVSDKVGVTTGGGSNSSKCSRNAIMNSINREKQKPYVCENIHAVSHQQV